MSKAIHSHPCPDCNGIRNCMVLFDNSTPCSKGLLFGQTNHYVLQCLGCGTIFFHICRKPLNVAFAAFSQAYYPATKIVQHNIPLHILIKHNDSGIFSLHAEVTAAINERLPQLASAGIRTIIDRICLDLTKSNKGFSENAKKLYELKYISEPQHEQLSIIIDLGSGVVHRRHVPGINDVVLCYEIITTLINTLYLHPTALQEVKFRTPERNKD